MKTSSAVEKLCKNFVLQLQVPVTNTAQRAHKRLVNVYTTLTIAFRIGSECPFIERLVLVKTFS